MSLDERLLFSGYLQFLFFDTAVYQNVVLCIVVIGAFG